MIQETSTRPVYRTNHHSPYWPVQFQESHQNRIVIQETAMVAYRGRKLTVAATILMSSIISQDVIEKIGQIASDTIKNPLKIKNPMGIFYINPINGTEEVCTQLLLNFSKMEHQMGLTKEECLTSLKKASSLVKEFMLANSGTGSLLFLNSDSTQANSFLFHVNQHEREIENWKKMMVIKSANAVYKKMGLLEVGKATLSEERCSFFGVKHDVYQNAAINMSCLTYALLLVGEKKATEFIFNMQKESSNELLNTIFIRLKEWGWRNVDAPNEGDLVLYFRSGTDIINHVGYYAEDGKIISKLGIHNPFVYRSGLFDLCGLVGTEFLFMRNSPI